MLYEIAAQRHAEDIRRAETVRLAPHGSCAVAVRSRVARVLRSVAARIEPAESGRFAGAAGRDRSAEAVWSGWLD